MTSPEFLKKIMEDNCLSQSELANRLSTTQATISRLLDGKYKISAAMRFEIVDEFDYTFNYVFREVD